MSRDQFFCGLFILAAANGLAGFVIGTITMQGWFAALLGLFGVSAIVWAACWAVTRFLYSSQPDEVIHAPDMAVGLGVLSMTILPFSKLSWLALTVLGLYMLWVSAAGSPRRRAASIALAITGPMLWGPALMDTFATPILQADAILVSNVLGTSHFGNVFSGAGGSRFAIYPACSSLHGISIAVLAWVTISNMLGVPWSARYVSCGILAAISVIAVNISRLSLIGLFPEHFSALHGSPGSDIAAWLSLALVLAISLLGVGREAFART